MDEVPEHDKAISPGEQPGTGMGTPHEQEEKTPKKELLPSEITLAELREDVFHRGGRRSSELQEKWLRQLEEEERAQKLAQELATKEHEVMGEDLSDQEDDDEKGKKTEAKPDKIIDVNIDGSTAKTAGLTAMDLFRGDNEIKKVRFVSSEDGVIKQFAEPFYLSWDAWGLHEPLYESLILPSAVEGSPKARELFDEVSALLHNHVILPHKDCSLLAYWAIATWFTDYLSFLPTVIISGPASTADLLLRTLVAVCRRPVLLGELSPAILRKLPINELVPTLLIREPQLSRYMSALLNASNRPGYLFFSGKTFQELYCPKCIYVGESPKDSPSTSNSVNINLGGSALTRRYALPAKEEITSFQNRLFSYRLLNHGKVTTANFRVSGFRPEVSIVADVLAAAIVDDVELQRGIIEALKDRDEQSRVDRATGVNGLVG